MRVGALCGEDVTSLYVVCVFVFKYTSVRGGSSVLEVDQYVFSMAGNDIDAVVFLIFNNATM